MQGHPDSRAHAGQESAVPEGHLIHHYAAEHERAFRGLSVAVSSPQGRFAEGARRLDGCRLERVEAYGKHLFYWWESDRVLHVHLGMRGTFLAGAAGARVLPQARLRMEAGDRGLQLIAPATCELLRPEERAAVVRRLGPDPLRNDADPEAAWASITGSSRPIGALLLDQSVLSGVGNVLRTEGLFLAGLHPLTRGDTLTKDDFDRLWAELSAVMRRAAEEGRIITVRPADRSVEEVPEAEGRYVYKQERCRRCGSLVDVPQVGGRTVYDCPVDQPWPEVDRMVRPA